MFKIVTKKELNPTVTLMDIEAPFVAKKAQPGQFIILRVDEDGEEIDPWNERFGEKKDYSQQTVISGDSKFCPYCGVRVEGDYTYCNKCGKKLP